MDKMTQYRQIVRDVLMPIVRRPYSIPTLAHEAVFDTENDRYLVMTIGWEGEKRRFHHCLVHLDIRDGKTWTPTPTIVATPEQYPSRATHKGKNMRWLRSQSLKTASLC